MLQYPHWTGRRDKGGRPICFFDIACLDAAAISSYTKSREKSSCDERQKRTTETASLTGDQRDFVFHDSLTRFVLPLCSAMRDRPHPETPITSAIYLVDVGSVGLKQGWTLRNYAQDISKLLATSFPEVLNTVYVSPYSLLRHFYEIFR